MSTRLPPEPPVGTVLQTRDDMDTYRIERLPQGWAIQYGPGESEHGLTHTTGRISWRAAWKAWGPPAGARPFTVVTNPPPAATPRTHTAPSSSTGVAVSASITEIRGTLAAVIDAISSAQGPIQHTIDEAIRARAALMAAMDGSNQADAEAAVAALTAMIESLEEAMGRSHQTVSTTQQVGARL